MIKKDVMVIGAGAAGMMCAGKLAAKGLSVALMDHAEKLGEKIRISGGGRCNFTNSGASWENYVSQNPRFARYALHHYTPDDFLQFLRQYQITWHEKHRGQLFCDESSQEIIRALYSYCQENEVSWYRPYQVKHIIKENNDFVVLTDKGRFCAPHLVIATGGMAAPAIGATDFGLGVARQFGLKIIEPRPALVPLVFDGLMWAPYQALAGISLEARISTQGSKQVFLEDILWTHKGLSGPGILQISSYWDGKSPLIIDLCPHVQLEALLIADKAGSKQQLLTVLSQYLPRRLAQHFMQEQGLSETVRWAEVSDKVLRQLATQLHHWTITPKGTAGYKKAEAMKGGVDTAEIDAKTMESKKMSGLYFIGEVLDVTGWLGGYNFQWAWSSASVCADKIKVC